VLAATSLELTVKVMVVNPAGTVTVPGTMAKGELLASVTAKATAADGATGILTVSQHAEFARAEPAGDDVNHFQSELRACSILLLGRLPGLFLFRLSIAAGRQFRAGNTMYRS
jgi:hypothetical protein